MLFLLFGSNLFFFQPDKQFISGTDKFSLQNPFKPLKLLRNYKVSIDRLVSEAPNKKSTNGAWL